MKTRWFPSLKTRAAAFFEAPYSPKPLGFFRVALAGFALLQAFLWYPDWLAFFGRDGWIQWEITGAHALPWFVQMQDWHRLLEPLGCSPDLSVKIFYWLYVISAAGLLIGWHTRVWAIFTWFGHFVIMNSMPTFFYGADIFLQISLFYLMVMPASKAYSLDLRQGRVSGAPSWGVTLSMRVLQIHLCLVYFSAGFEKLVPLERAQVGAPQAHDGSWWDGNVLWRAMVQPDFSQFDVRWLADYPWIMIALSWFTMIIETGYFFGMWVPRLRVLWLAGIVSLHLGIGLFLGLWLFGLIMILLSLSAFGHEALRDIKRMRRSRPDLEPGNA